MALAQIGHVKRTGFETKFLLRGAKVDYVQVGAYQDGKVVRKSSVVAVK